jgi:hypothetical protein
MSTLRRAGAVAAAGLLSLLTATPRVDAYPWPKRRVVIGQAPVMVPGTTMVGQAPVATTFGQAPVVMQGTTVAQAPTLTLGTGSAPTTATVAQAPTTLTLTPSTTASAPAVGSAPTTGTSTVIINGQTFTIGAAPSANAPTTNCTLSAEDEQAILEDLRSYRRTELKDNRNLGEKRRELIEQAVTMLEEFCEEADETTRRAAARKLANRAMTDEATAEASTVYYTAPSVAPTTGMVVQPAAAPMFQPVVPVLLQPVPQHKCWRCLHRAFCPHKAYYP